MFFKLSHYLYGSLIVYFAGLIRFYYSTLIREFGLLVFQGLLVGHINMFYHTKRMSQQCCGVLTFIVSDSEVELLISAFNSIQNSLFSTHNIVNTFFLTRFF